jgi:hypothetical protein
MIFFLFLQHSSRLFGLTVPHEDPTIDRAGRAAKVKGAMNIIEMRRIFVMEVIVINDKLYTKASVLCLGVTICVSIVSDISECRQCAKSRVIAKNPSHHGISKEQC